MFHVYSGKDSILGRGPVGRALDPWVTNWCLSAFILYQTAPSLIMLATDLPPFLKRETLERTVGKTNIVRVHMQAA